VKVSGTHPGRLSLKRFGVFGCVGLGSNAHQFIYDTVRVGQPETPPKNCSEKKYGDNRSFVEVSFAPELGGRSLLSLGGAVGKKRPYNTQCGPEHSVLRR